MSEKLAPAERLAYVTDSGQKVYEWDQTLSEVNAYFEVPPGVKAKQLAVEITSTRLRVGLKGNPPFLERDLCSRVKASECFWTLDGNALHIQLCKAERGEPWQALLAGHDIDLHRQEQEKQRLMLERFQEEHPGFDFSGAKFNGEAPDPRSFMGGVGPER